jgi:two-component system, NtrC family, response regulator HydG
MQDPKGAWMSGEKISVLVVDDEKIVRDFFQRLLSLLGLEATVIDSGYKAVEAAKANKFDLYFIDVRMPGLNGLETYRQVRQIDPAALVVMITGYAVDDILEQADREGVYGNIRKPFDINQIKDVLDKVVTGKPKEQMNILVVDDDDAVLNFFISSLTRKGLNCKIAHNKGEAISMAKNDKFNLIFLDVVLADSNGVEIYKILKDILPEADVVLISGYPQKAKAIENEIEIAGCLYKPFEISSILKYIEAVKSKVK